MVVTTRWLWREQTALARATRGMLLPAAGCYGATMWLRRELYRRGVLRGGAPPLPTACVGNLTVGGSGKTPLAAWIARRYATLGVRPGVILRGYGGDEAAIHRAAAPSAIVVADRDRPRAARRAVVLGAQVLVLDDGYQRLDLQRHLNIAVVSTESVEASPWLMPAGPWREPWSALDRADLIVVTRKHRTGAEAKRLAARLAARCPFTPVAMAHLTIAELRGLTSDRFLAPSTVRGARVVAVAGIADPEAFAAQCGAFGAEVQLMARRDHHAYTRRDVTDLLQAGASADYVVVTEKDAVKLRDQWPDSAREPWVARLAIAWEQGRGMVERALDRLITERVS